MPKKMCEDADETSKDRDDLVEAGKRLKAAKALEGKASGLGVKSKKKAWGNRYPKGGKT